MLGNLIKESGVVPKLTETLSNSLLYIVTILLGLSVGATAVAETFLKIETLKSKLIWNWLQDSSR